MLRARAIRIATLPIEAPRIGVARLGLGLGFEVGDEDGATVVGNEDLEMEADVRGGLAAKWGGQFMIRGQFW